MQVQKDLVDLSKIYIHEIGVLKINVSQKKYSLIHFGLHNLCACERALNQFTNNKNLINNVSCENRKPHSSFIEKIVGTLLICLVNEKDVWSSKTMI